MKSTFSGKEIPRGTGKMYVKKDGKIIYFASKKEEKNMLKLGRNPRKVKWAFPKKATKAVQPDAQPTQLKKAEKTGEKQ